MNYYIKIWETELNRDQGESYIAEILQDKNEAIEQAKKYYYRQNYACIEVENQNGELIYEFEN
jgi:hypothetical protein